MCQKVELLDIATGMSWSERFEASSRAALRASNIKKVDARATNVVLTVLTNTYY